MATTSAPPTQSPAAAPKLTRIDLHGFKSFATKTSIVFEPGITAVVGPNGSGKSNISDAVRWVLGETSYTSLRSKKTEDVIFAGGKGKAPAGMAEVTVTFNNETHWLPSEFVEVTVTRRAFRGGDTQYFINGRRVRRKDIAHLTASLGQSYTVVGQGLVDSALSQRPEDRRGLFEHAADLSGIQMKVTEAERSLAETETNSQRLTDLLEELAPRLRTLQRQAKQAQEWQGLRDRLSGLQRGLYRLLLREATERAAECERTVAQHDADLTTAQERLDTLDTRRDAVRERSTTARQELEAHDARLAELRDNVRQTHHERDLVEERQGALQRRRDDMRDTQSGLDEQLSALQVDLERVQQAVADLDNEYATARDRVAALQSAAKEQRDARAALERETNELATTMSRLEREVNEVQQQRAVLAHRQQGSTAEQEQTQREIDERSERIAGLERELAAFDSADAELITEIDELTAQLEQVQSSRTQAEADVTAAHAIVSDLETRLGQATNRLDVLQRLHESGTGLYAGVRQVMEWHRDGSLTGVRGTLAELISVDATYDTAIEVALGSHLQDVVVDQWRDAEAAIDMLKRTRAGRATFQPIETIRRRDRNRPAPDAVTNASGVHGVAADLALCDDDVAPVVRALLGRIVVVADLPTARDLLPTLPNGWSTVTLAGEIARSGGSVTGGSAVRESGVLGRERELRELPAEVERLKNELQRARAEHQSQTETVQQLTERHTTLESERVERRVRQRERGGQRQRLTAWLDDLHTERKALEQRAEAARVNHASQTESEAELESRLAELQSELKTTSDQHHAATERLTAIREAGTTDETALAAAQRELAGLEERRRAEQRRESDAHSQQEALREEMRLRTHRVTEVEAEQATLAEQMSRLQDRVQELDGHLAGATAARTPIAETVSQAETEASAWESQIEEARQSLLQQERVAGQQHLTAERARAELLAIQTRITDDLALESPEALLSMSVEGEAEEEVMRDDSPERRTTVEQEITRLKERLRRVGYVGEDVVAEYERESQHQEFLRTQLEDVNTAASSLHQMLAELRETMEQRFEETFARVSEAFTESFTTLFGGGTARLVLTESDSSGDPAGVDIVAQPPGKRLQGLGLLSGGERALTGVALLFAILRVNPSPFVLLDEVDAALDEANVVRFREELMKLAQETQAIVITHNRGTVEIADTLYGVSMGGDGVSQTLSLRLSDIPLDDDVDVSDLPAVTAGIPNR